MKDRERRVINVECTKRRMDVAMKLDSAHQKVSTSSPELPIFSEQPLLETKYLLSALRNTPENATILVHPPPLLSENSIYLKNSVFLI